MLLPKVIAVCRSILDVSSVENKFAQMFSIFITYTVLQALLIYYPINGGCLKFSSSSSMTFTSEKKILASSQELVKPGKKNKASAGHV